MVVNFEVREQGSDGKQKNVEIKPLRKENRWIRVRYLNLGDGHRNEGDGIGICQLVQYKANNYREE